MDARIKAAVAESRAALGAVVTLDVFTYEDAEDLAEMADDYGSLEPADSSDERSYYRGSGWCVELVGCGDPRRTYDRITGASS